MIEDLLDAPDDNEGKPRPTGIAVREPCKTSAEFDKLAKATAATPPIAIEFRDEDGKVDHVAWTMDYRPKP